MDNVLVIGIGGAGSQITPFVKDRLDCDDFAVNTDSAALKRCASKHKLLLGPSVCKGAPANTPARGRLAVEESRSELERALAGMSTVIIVTGLGGGTGTGAAPAILALARSLGLDVIVAATLPFKFETERREVALNGLAELHLEEERLVLLDHAESLNNLGVHQKTLLEVFEESAKNIADEVYRLLTCRFP